MNEETEANGSSSAETTRSVEMPGGSACRLAVYGTLAPGRPNHHQLNGLSGRWIKGTVRGRLFQEAWGADIGYPGIVLEPDGSRISVQLFESLDLPDHWSRLDEFEGSGYIRTVTAVSIAEGDLLACIYALARH
jgi:gamma-glutamylcyclotransferase (GGCT)/AIG2-like uncharacterized protein YtfP